MIGLRGGNPGQQEEQSADLTWSSEHYFPLHNVCGAITHPARLSLLNTSGAPLSSIRM
jgi:hypothetical protein